MEPSKVQLHRETFDAALAFDALQLWESYDDRVCFPVRLPGSPHLVFASVMGAGGQEYGLAVTGARVPARGKDHSEARRPAAYLIGYPVLPVGIEGSEAVFADRELHDAFALTLAPLGVECRYEAGHPLLEDLKESMQEWMRAGRPEPGHARRPAFRRERRRHRPSARRERAALKARPDLDLRQRQ